MSKNKPQNKAQKPEELALSQTSPEASPKNIQKQTQKDSEQIRKRVALLLAAKRAYYQSDNSDSQTEQVLMTDAEFDQKEEELRQWDPENSYFQIVGVPQNTPKQDMPADAGPESSSREKIRHMVAMLSMDKVKKVEGVVEWFQHLQKNFQGEQAEQSESELDEETPLCIQPKVDGISASCYYSNGELQYVATRGDGQVGQDISHVAKYISQIPQKLDFGCISAIDPDAKEHFEVRGELYIPKDTKLQTDGKPLRNICSGLVNRKEQNQEQSQAQKQAELRYLNFVAYQCPQTRLDDSEYLQIEKLAELGFHTIATKRCPIGEVAPYAARYLAQLRSMWNYETDGLIICIDDSRLFEAIDALWVVQHHHHYAIALKPPAESGSTILQNVVWQVGRQGRLSPVAQFLPLRLSGAVIERASLHNYANVCRLELHCGDILEVERSGDVIPYVRSNLGDPSSLLNSPNDSSGLSDLSDLNNRPLHCTEEGQPVDLQRACAIAAELCKERENGTEKQSANALIPQSCPSCGTELEQESKDLVCRNRKCPEQCIQRILFWIQQAEMDQIAEQSIRQLYELGKLKSLQDLYRLSEADFASIPGYADKKTKNFVYQLQKSRQLNVQELIERLGIPAVQQKSLSKLGELRRKSRWDQLIQLLAQNRSAASDSVTSGSITSGSITSDAQAPEAETETQKKEQLLAKMAHGLAKVLPEWNSEPSPVQELFHTPSHQFSDEASDEASAALSEPQAQIYQHFAEKLLAKLLEQVEQILAPQSKRQKQKQEQEEASPTPLDRLLEALGKKSGQAELWRSGFAIWQEFLLSQRPHFLEVLSLEDFTQFREPESRYSVINALSTWLRENQVLLQELLPALDIVNVNAQAATSKSSKTVCMTGNGPLPRKQLQEKLEAAGYAVVSQMTKNTDILLASDLSGGSSKLKKAAAWGVTLLSYEDFFKDL